MFSEKTEYLKIFLSGCAAVGVKMLGGSFKHVIVLIGLIAVDTVFGWAKGKKLNKWNSKEARWGAVGKIAELIFVAVLYMLDWLFSIDYLKYMGIYYFGICEIASIFENYAEINGNLPDGTIDIVKKLQFSLGTFVVEKLRKSVSKFIIFENDKEENESKKGE